MRFMRSMMLSVLMLAVFFAIANAQTPAPAGQRGGAAAPAGQRGGGGGGRGGGAPAANLTVMTTAWADGGMIPLRYTQAGPELSPQIQWANVPSGTASFVLTFTDADSLVNGSTDGLLHWMVWNIPGTAGNLAQGQPDGFELPNGTWQMSVSGARYRGPGAPASGPIHHYILELYALDTMLDIKVPPQSPQENYCTATVVTNCVPSTQTIRTSIMQAMVGHIRGKAAYFGLFHRPQ